MYGKTSLLKNRLNVLVLIFGCYLSFSLFVVGPYNPSNTQNLHILVNSWSPDGKNFLFQAESKGNYIFDAQNFDHWKFNHNQSGFDWSANGSQLIYLDNAWGSLYIVDIESKEKRQLFTCPIYCVHPQWSPDELSIVFQSYAQPYQAGSEATYYGFNIKDETFDYSLIRKPDWYEIDTQIISPITLTEQYSKQFTMIARLIKSPDKKLIAIENDGNIHIINQAQKKTIFTLNEKSFYRIFPFQFKTMQGLLFLFLVFCVEFLMIGQKVKSVLKQP